MKTKIQYEPLNLLTVYYKSACPSFAFNPERIGIDEEEHATSYCDIREDCKNFDKNKCVWRYRFDEPQL